MTLLRDPLNILSQPSEEGATTGYAKSTKETARWDPVQTGLCPVCQQQMALSDVNSVPSYVCLEHRICLPKAVE